MPNTIVNPAPNQFGQQAYQVHRKFQQGGRLQQTPYQFMPVQIQQLPQVNNLATGTPNSPLAITGQGQQLTITEHGLGQQFVNTKTDEPSPLSF